VPANCAYDYAVIRVVPEVTRGEFVNAGVILFCRPARYLAVAIDLDVARLLALAPGIDLDDVRAQLALIPAMCEGTGPIGALGQSEVFHWVVAPHSTLVQCSDVHTGLTDDLPAALEHLLNTLVRVAQLTINN
jgi:hypothetical protein